MNPSVAGGNHAAVHLEHQVIAWFAALLGWHDGHAGQLVSGGSAATLTGLQVATHHALRRAGYNDRRDGLSALDRELVVYATDEAHSCVTKAAEALGIGAAHITRIPTDGDRRLDTIYLDTVLDKDRAAGKLPIAVIASIGTVNTGAIDPLTPISTVCARHDVWLHVDGAYGAPAVLLLDDWPDVRAGLARADSVALDPHKWLYGPVDCGMILFRDEAIVRDTFSHVPDYLRTSGDEDEPVWYSEYGLEQTRPFRALKLWMQLKHLGQDGYRALIARDMAVAGELRALLDEAPDFQILAHGLSVVCFRHLDPLLRTPTSTTTTRPCCARFAPPVTPSSPARGSTDTSCSGRASSTRSRQPPTPAPLSTRSGGAPRPCADPAIASRRRPPIAARRPHAPAASAPALRLGSPHSGRGATRRGAVRMEGGEP
jgi:aromatic-L-amino-acid decarboxylase